MEQEEDYELWIMEPKGKEGKVVLAAEEQLPQEESAREAARALLAPFPGTLFKSVEKRALLPDGKSKVVKTSLLRDVEAVTSWLSEGAVVVARFTDVATGKLHRQMRLAKRV